MAKFITSQLGSGTALGPGGGFRYHASPACVDWEGAPVPHPDAITTIRWGHHRCRLVARKLEEKPGKTWEAGWSTVTVTPHTVHTLTFLNAAGQRIVYEHKVGAVYTQVVDPNAPSGALIPRLPTHPGE